MHIYTLQKWQHTHDFSSDSQANERKTLRVVILTAVMMGVEIGAGMLFGSMALLADGWHMGTHAAALGITLFAYRYAGRHAGDPQYTFGTGKMSVLGGFTSAIVLMMVALLMAGEALGRLFNPQDIHYGEAILVAALGLVVNLVSVRLLGDHHHGHEHHEHEHAQHEHAHAQREHADDHNIKAAYLHVLADALTSVLAIAALLAGRFLGWAWMDAVMGIVGSLLIGKWALGLLRDTSHILLDGRPGPELAERIRACIETGSDSRISDMHVWKIGENAAAAIISLVTHYPQPVEHYRRQLSNIEELKHVTIEVNVCTEAPCLSVTGEEPAASTPAA